MNKQQAIEELKEQSWEYENRYFQYELVIHLEDAQEIVSQIDEPKKIKIPQFVADWLEYMKENKYSLRDALERASERAEVYEWMYPENELVFVRAWLDGYEVEQEQLYTVEIPDPNSYFDYKYLSRNDKGICLDASNDTKWKEKKTNQFTESEIKQDFEWAWDAGFAEPVEVQEVE